MDVVSWEKNGPIWATDWGLYDSKILDIIQGVLKFFNS